MKQGETAFTSLNINCKLRHVEITATEDGDCGYEIKSTRFSKIIHEIKGATLYITEKLNRLFIFTFFFDMLRGLSKFDIKIKIPKNRKLDVVTLKNTSGNTTVKEIRCIMVDMRATSGNISFAAGSAEQFRAGQTSGRLNIDGCQLENAEIKNTSGKVEISQARMRGLAVSTTSGKVGFTGDLTGYAEIKSTSGGIDLDLTAKKQNYDLNIDVLSGNIYIDGQKQPRQKGIRHSKDNAGRNELRVKTISGHVRLNFGGEK
jgi:DUF4097 and DUF4098 domain-containing protein YvlB